MIFPNIYNEWYRLVGNTEVYLEQEPKLMNLLCTLADGYTRNVKGDKIPRDVGQLTSFGVIDLFMSGDYRINIMGLDVVYGTCKLNIPKQDIKEEN